MHEESIDQIVERMVAGHGQSRREFLRLIVAAGVTTGAGSLITACASSEGTQGRGENQSERAATVDHPKTEIGRWTWSNWPLYMDKKLLREFERRFGGRVRYLEDINDNNQFTGAVQQRLRQGIPIGRDIVVLTDTTAAQWIRNGWLEPIDWTNIPNRANVAPAWSRFDYDPDGRFLLPYQSGAIGIGYDRELTGGRLTSFEPFFYDERLRGRVTCLSDEESACFAILMLRGIRPADATLEQKLDAIDEVGRIAATGQFRRFTGGDYTTDLATGNAWASMAYSGDVVQLQSDNPGLEFAYPEEGALMWTDHMMMPAEAEHPYAAETMMNYLYEPEVAAKLAVFVNYFSPVNGVREILADEDPEIGENELIFPPQDIQARLHTIPAVTAADKRAAQEAMANVTGG